MEWTNAEVEELVKLYKLHPELYDPKNKLYCSKMSRIKAFSDISLEISKPNTTAEDIKRKLTLLRSHYSHEKAKQITRSCGRDEIYVSTRFWFPLLTFLDDYIKSRKPKSNGKSKFFSQSLIDMENSSSSDIIPDKAELFSVELRDDHEDDPLRKRTISEANSSINEDDESEKEELHLPMKKRKPIANSSISINEDDESEKELHIPMKKRKSIDSLVVSCSEALTSITSQIVQMNNMKNQKIEEMNESVVKFSEFMVSQLCKIKDEELVDDTINELFIVINEARKKWQQKKKV